METYGQFCPLSKASELLAERWTLLVLRELLLGSERFAEIQRGVPTMSPSLLSKRLRSLERAGVIVKEKRPGAGFSYRPTAAALELQPLIVGLSAWGHRWLRTDYRDEDLDPSFLMWDIRRNVKPEALGERKIVVSFSFPAARSPQKTFWLVSAPGDADLCMTDPGYPVDVEVVADLRALTKVWLGDLTLSAARRTDAIRIEGRPASIRQFERWLGQHPLAVVQRGR